MKITLTEDLDEGKLPNTLDFTFGPKIIKIF